jgi:hypothetical protein
MTFLSVGGKQEKKIKNQPRPKKTKMERREGEKTYP